MIRFIVPGNPQAWERVRINRQTGGFFTAAKTANFENKVAMFAKAHGVHIFKEQVKLTVDFYLKRPKRLMRKSDKDFALLSKSRPDLDNLIKSIKDALIGICYLDDSQVCQLIAAKYYHGKSEAPRTEILIECADGWKSNHA